MTVASNTNEAAARRSIADKAFAEGVAMLCMAGLGLSVFWLMTTLVAVLPDTFAQVWGFICGLFGLVCAVGAGMRFQFYLTNLK